MSETPGSPYDSDTPPFKQRNQASITERTFPVSAHLSDYPKRSGRRDLIAGVTVAALAIPAGLAYAQLAGLSPVAGLYTLLLPAVAYALLGSSRQLSVGPEGSLAVLAAAAVAPLAHGDATRYAALTGMLAVLVGGVYLVARLVRLGWIADYFSRPVLVGYIHGVAIVLIVGQLGKVFGLSISARDPLPQLREFLDEISDTHLLTVIIGTTSVAVLLLLRLRFKRIPGALVVVLASIAVSYAFDLESRDVAVVGHIPSGLPSFDWPGIGIGDVVKLLPAAIGIFFVGYGDAILTARSFAGRHHDHVHANQELAALGVANVAAGVTQGFVVGASGSRTAVNDQTGGRTQVVGLIAAVVVAVVLLFLTAPVAKLPNACLGAVIIVAAIGLFDPAAWRALALAGRSQVLIAVVTFAGVVAVGVLEALIVAVALSIIDVVRRSAKPHDAVLGWVERMGRYADVSLHPSAQVTDGVVVYRLDDRLIFTNASYVKGRIREAIAGAPTRTQWLVFDADGVTGVDASGLAALEDTINALAHDNVRLALARAKTPLVARLDAAGITALVGDENTYPTVRAAVQGCAAKENRGDE